MNKSLRLVGLLLVALFFTAVAAEAQGRIATVELNKVFEQYWKTKRAKVALADRESDLKKDIAEMEETHKKLIQQYQKHVVDANDQAVSSEEREKRKKGLDGKVKEIKESEETLKQMASRSRADLEQMAKRMMDDVLTDITDAVAAKGKAGGYAFVVDASAEAISKARVFLYNSGENDLTATIIDQLNAAAPPEPAASSEKPAAKK